MKLDSKGNIKIVFNKVIPFAGVWKQVKEKNEKSRKLQNAGLGSTLDISSFNKMFALELTSDEDGKEDHKSIGYTYEIVEMQDTFIIIKIKWNDIK